MQKKGNRLASLKDQVPIEEVDDDEDSPLLNKVASNSPICVVEELGTGRVHARLSTRDDGSAEMNQLIANASAENIVLPNIIPQMGSPGS